jgi:NAD(P)H-dependent FMN reductase
MATIALINGSVQKKNYTGFILRIVKDELEKNGLDVIDIRLEKYNMPFPGDEIENDNSKELREKLSSADAFIIGSPEYNGGYTAKLKLMIENSGYPSAMKGKPVGLVGLASGILGATKSLEQLRIVCSHIGSIVLPRVTSISEVEKRFDDEGNCIDEGTEKEIKASAKNLTKFISLIGKVNS